MLFFAFPFYFSWFTVHLLPFTFHLSPVTVHLLLFTFHPSPVIGHQSSVISHQSLDTNHNPGHCLLFTVYCLLFTVYWSQNSNFPLPASCFHLPASPLSAAFIVFHGNFRTKGFVFQFFGLGNYTLFASAFNKFETSLYFWLHASFGKSTHFEVFFGIGKV